MSQRILRIQALTDKQLVVLLTLGSALFTTWIMYVRHGWITEDSTLYFEMARLFSIGEWKQGFALYGWPLYPALISIVHKSTGLGILQSGQVLNVFLFALATHGFLSLIRLAGGSKDVIICGALLLFSASYIVGDILPMLLRDEGFWAFFLVSLGYLLRFHRTGEFRYALYWQVSIIIAMLFRIEAFVYLLSTPLFMLRNNKKPLQNRLRSYCKTQVFTLSAGAGIGLLLAFSPTLQLEDFGRIEEFFTTFSRLYSQLTEGLSAKAKLMGKLVLGKYLDDYGMLSIVLALVSIVISKIIGAAGWQTMLILATPQPERLHGLKEDARELILWIIAIGAIIASIIILNRFILSSRYLAPLAFMLLLLGAFALSNMWRYLKIKDSSKITLLMLTISVLLVCSNFIKNIMPPAGDYNFEQAAVAWVKENSTPQKTVFISDAKLRYYAGQPYVGRDDPLQWTLQAIKNHSIHNYDYLLISLDRNSIEQREYLTRVLERHRLVRKFNRGAKKVVLIYEKKDAVED